MLLFKKGNYFQASAWFQASIKPISCLWNLTARKAAGWNGVCHQYLHAITISVIVLKQEISTGVIHGKRSRLYEWFSLDFKQRTSFFIQISVTGACQKKVIINENVQLRTLFI